MAVMSVASLDHKALASRLRGGALAVRCGPVVTRVRSNVPALFADIADVYRDYPVETLSEVSADICVDVHYSGALRRFIRPQVKAIADRPGPFAPLPPDLGFVGFEMAQNWHIANTHNRHLLFHSGCVAGPQGKAILMPGMSGSGKSTLSAAMGFRRWRFLGDEFALFDWEGNGFRAVPRPISLKNASIEVLRAWAPDAGFSRTFENTPKGRMAYGRPPVEALDLTHDPAPLLMVVFPKFAAGEEPRARRLRQAEALVDLTNACVNFDRLGETAFGTLADWAETIPCFHIIYPSLDAAIDMIGQIEERLLERGP